MDTMNHPRGYRANLFQEAGQWKAVLAQPAHTLFIQ